MGNKTCFSKGRLTILQDKLRGVTDWFIVDNPKARARDFINNYKLVPFANIVAGTGNIGYNTSFNTSINS